MYSLCSCNYVLSVILDKTLPILNVKILLNFTGVQYNNVYVVRKSGSNNSFRISYYFKILEI